MIELAHSVVIGSLLDLRENCFAKSVVRLHASVFAVCFSTSTLYFFFTDLSATQDLSAPAVICEWN